VHLLPLSDSASSLWNGAALLVVAFIVAVSLALALAMAMAAAMVTLIASHIFASPPPPSERAHKRAEVVASRFGIRNADKTGKARAVLRN